MNHKILVVDDNSATRRMVRMALQCHGHAVLEAPDGATARELMAREQPRVVLQDLMLPDADGFALVGELRGLAGSDVSILAFSGFVSELDEARVSSVGFDDIIAKPIAPSRLVPIIEAHLPAPAPQADQFGAGRRIVIADDDPMQLKLASYRLSRIGFDVEACSDGRAALDAVRRRSPVAVVSDVMMPELDGFGLAMALRTDPKLHRVPIVLVTSSYVETADRDLARRAGATDLVPRTPELVEVLEALRSTLSKGRTPEPEIKPEVLSDLEREHNHRVFRQLERQVMLNAGLAKRCSALASELTVLTGISEAVLKQRDVDVALDEALAECFDAGGISVGALYLVDRDDKMRVRPISAGTTPVSDLATLFGHEQLLRDTIRERRTLAVPSGATPSDVEAQLLDAARASAMLVVPLVHLDRTLGSLLMVARGRELDDDDWRNFAHGVATQISHVLALARAYDERERAERKATEHASLLDALFEGAPDTVLQLDLAGTIRFVNRKTAPYTGDLLGVNIFDIPTGEHRDALRKAFDRLIETGQPQGFEAPLVREPNTAPVWYSTRLGPVREAGRLAGAVVISRDINESKQTELHLMVADRMASVGTLAAGVAHEINNPLASVIANLDMAISDLGGLAARTALPPDLTDELADARAAADRVREIVRDLKIFSRAEEDRRGPVDVEHVLESTIRMAWNELRHRAKLVKRYTRVPEVDANESRLGQVFLNLIINAAHAIPPGNYEANQIRIATSVDADGRVVVSIGDTGAGIPMHVRPRLFTPFFTTKPVGVGTGLGLAISHRIISQFGGSIAYDSEVGKGTEFRVTLPVATQPGIVAPEPPTAATPARRGSVLVIDDEEPLALAIKRFLSEDHDVTAVHSAAAALEVLTTRRFDVILCDLMMPQVTGMQFHQELTRLDASQAARVVFVTGGAFTVSAREFLDQVPNLRIEKPFDLKLLRALINEMVR
ncbi:MAG: response regulator [Deltaproteobacteria bacterium]|nr:response regulator [Deltaproteobacteria bacterium]